jgi:predicted dehydrogenase
VHPFDESGPVERLRVGVIGAGRVSQVAHLPWLAFDTDHFEVTAIADVSPRLAERVGTRYGCKVLPSAQDLLELPLDAVVCATPIPLHKDVVVEALGLGLHVLCEKPAALTLRDCDEMIGARDRAGRVVQVGYMKRFDPAVTALLAMLPSVAERLRYLSAHVIDSSHRPFTAGLELVEPDVPEVWRERIQALEDQQVREAAGPGHSAAAYWAYRHGYAGSLVHDVNLAHTVLDALGYGSSVEVAAGRYWDGGRGVGLSFHLDGGGFAEMAHVALPGVPIYREQLTLCFDERIMELSFPSPFSTRRQASLVEHRDGGPAGLRTTHLHGGHDDPFRLQLRRFHAAVTGTAPPVNTLEEARRDLDLLLRAHAAAVLAEDGRRSPRGAR